MPKPKKLELRIGDAIVLTRWRNAKVTYDYYHVVKLNKKSIVFQNWPTNEQRAIKFK